MSPHEELNFVSKIRAIESGRLDLLPELEQIFLNSKKLSLNALEEKTEECLSKIKGRVFVCSSHLYFFCLFLVLEETFHLYFFCLLGFISDHLYFFSLFLVLVDLF